MLFSAEKIKNSHTTWCGASQEAVTIAGRRKGHAGTPTAGCPGPGGFYRYSRKKPAQALWANCASAPSVKKLLLSLGLECLVVLKMSP